MPLRAPIREREGCPGATSGRVVVVVVVVVGGGDGGDGGGGGCGGSGRHRQSRGSFSFSTAFTSRVRSSPREGASRRCRGCRGGTLLLVLSAARLLRDAGGDEGGEKSRSQQRRRRASRGEGRAKRVPVGRHVAACVDYRILLIVVGAR